MTSVAGRLRRCFAASALLLSCISVAYGQEPPPPTVDLTAGWVGFVDDVTVNEPAIGAAVRWYVSPRLALGPELLYMRGDNRTHLVLVGALTWDVLPAANSPRVTPFLVAGAGMFQTHERFFDDSITSSEGAFTAGGGVRARVSDRVSAGLDARIGWELHVRVGAFAAIRLRRPP